MNSPELLVQQGDMRRRQGQHESAFNSFTEAYRICTETGDRKGRAVALLGVAEVHRDRCELKQAVDVYSQALQIWTELNDSRRSVGSS